MTDNPMEAASTSQITSNRRAPIIDIATNRPIGYFSSEYLNTRARIGLVFSHHDKVWKILHITDEETVYVLSSKDREALIRSYNNSPSEETHDSSWKRGSANALPRFPIPTSKLIIIESFKKNIIIHAAFGTRLNMTLRLVFDAMLTEQDLIRDSFNDDIRILIQTPSKLTNEELVSVSGDLFHISSGEFDRLLIEALEARFPTIIAWGDSESNESQTENALKDVLGANLAVKPSKAIFRRISEGEIKIRTHFSMFRATSLAEELINRHVRLTAVELDAFIKQNVIQLRRSIGRENVELLCLNCLSSHATARISDLEEKPKCKQCGSSLLALAWISTQAITSLLHKKKSLKHLNQAETEQLARTRRTADLILSYGKRAIIALSVPGVGPQTASSILASMPANDSELYNELLKARIQYITTRELWDRRQKPNLSGKSR